jgi:O-6-methylguanine DNA methyltransferase
MTDRLDDRLQRFVLDSGTAPARPGDLLAALHSRTATARDLPRAFVVHASDRGITRVRPADVSDEAPEPAMGRAASRLARRAEGELLEYVRGERAFFDVPVDLSALAPFHQLVLAQAQRIPHGAALTYGELARRVGHPRAARAVGTALAKNPVPLIVPCHRVLRAGGDVGQYAFGPRMKAALLQLERMESPLVGCSTTHVLCRAGCAAERRMRRDHCVAFASIADARSVGYRPCRLCQPRP